MEAKTDQDRRRLIIWWSAGGTAFLVVMALLFWVGFQTGPAPEPPVANPQASDEAAPVDGQSISEAGNPDGSADSTPTSRPQTEPAATPPVPEGDPEANSSPDDESEPTSLQSPGSEEALVLPANWTELSPIDKISLNPFDCDLSRQEVDLDDGQCRRRSTLSSQSRPWRPMALNLVPATEVSNRSLEIACYDQDLTYLLNQPSQPQPSGAVDWRGLSPQNTGANAVGQSPADTANLGESSRHCILRVVLEMTIDDFYFPNGCRTWRAGFVRLAGTENGRTKTYDSLAAPAPGVVCTKVVVPIAKGQQIEQIFLFEIPSSDLGLEISDIKFNLLEPKLTFSGDFSLETGDELPIRNSP